MIRGLHISILILLFPIVGMGQHLSYKDLLILSAEEYLFPIKQRQLEKAGFEKIGEMMAPYEGKKVTYIRYYDGRDFLGIATDPDNNNYTHFVSYTMSFDSLAQAAAQRDSVFNLNFPIIQQADPIKVSNGHFSVSVDLKTEGLIQLNVIVIEVYKASEGNKHRNWGPTRNE